jgi:hypothetical protein
VSGSALGLSARAKEAFRSPRCLTPIQSLLAVFIASLDSTG